MTRRPRALPLAALLASATLTVSAVATAATDTTEPSETTEAESTGAETTGVETSEVASSLPGAGVGPGCADLPDFGDGALPELADDPIGTAISNILETSTLQQLLGDDLLETLDGEGPFTVFAPENAAFVAVDPAVRDSWSDPAVLEDALSYHVIEGASLSTEDLADAGTATSLQGGELSFELDGDVLTINGEAGVVCGDIPVANGTLFIIDSVLISPDAPAPATTEATGTTEVAETTAVETTAVETTEVATTEVATTEVATTAVDTTAVATSEPATTLPPFEPESLQWTPTEFDGVEEATLEVPIDYANPDAGTFELYLVRDVADNPDERIGSLLVNPGGPGFGGTVLALNAAFIYDQTLLDHFDIVGWDPRGTGFSEPHIDCVGNLDDFNAGTDITPDDEAERQEIIDNAEEFATQCAENNAEILQFVGTNNTARDMDTIRQALGEDEISYFGFSYGSELGATWATLFPDTVRAAVLDGASDPNASELEGSLQQTAGFESTLATFLAACSADASCPFYNDGDAEGAFDELMLKIDQKPLPTEDGRPPLTRSMALQAVAEAMYNDAIWPDLQAALAAAQQGDGSQLLALYDSYYQYQGDGSWDDSLEAFQTIHCMDSAERPSVEDEDATVPEFQAIAPRFAPHTTGAYFCTFFPVSDDPRVEITGAGAGPIVVCGATGDAATPLESTRAMAESLEDGRLIVIEADQHTCYGVNACADDLINDYLVNLVAPPEETLCP